MGAWIETVLDATVKLQLNVAPYVGAWIETIRSRYNACCWIVAPYVGAWIETTICGIVTVAGVSLPTWERGLKRRPGMKVFFSELSLPTWERGLKRNKKLCGCCRTVAPYVGAWIET